MLLKSHIYYITEKTTNINKNNQKSTKTNKYLLSVFNIRCIYLLIIYSRPFNMNDNELDNLFIILFWLFVYVYYAIVNLV